MLKIERTGTTVRATFTASINWQFYFDHGCSDEPYAIFLANDLNSRLWNITSEIRKKAYEQGWRDKSRKERKKDWFSGKFDVNAQF